MMRRHLFKYLGISMLLVFSAMALAGCMPDTGIRHTRVKTTAESNSKRTSIDRAQLEMSEDQWKPIFSADQAIETRNPFRGFSDKIMAENMMRQKKKEEVDSVEMQLPEQLYNIRDYKVVGLITGTADPKVFVTDPAGNRFVLRRGSLIGNNNGSISSIRRDGIEVYERVADKGQYIELPLYDAKVGEHKNIHLTLQ